MFYLHDSTKKHNTPDTSYSRYPIRLKNLQNYVVFGNIIKETNLKINEFKGDNHSQQSKLNNYIDCILEKNFLIQSQLPLRHNGSPKGQSQGKLYV